MPFLPPNQQRQSTEGNHVTHTWKQKQITICPLQHYSFQLFWDLLNKDHVQGDICFSLDWHINAFSSRHTCNPSVSSSSFYNISRRVVRSTKPTFWMWQIVTYKFNYCNVSFLPSEISQEQAKLYIFKFWLCDVVNQQSVSYAPTV